VTIAVGGEYGRQRKIFRPPHGAAVRRPTDEAFSTEYFGPILSVHVYADDDYDRILDVVDKGAKYALTGAVIATTGRGAGRRAAAAPRGGNFYVQRQAHRGSGGAAAIWWMRASGTNDKAGSALNLLDGPRPGRSRKRSSRRPTTTTPHGGWTMADVFSRVVRPAILAASRADGLRRAAERLPVTRKVVQRFVPGETAGDALNAVEQLRHSGRMISIGYLGEDVTDVDTANRHRGCVPCTARRARYPRRAVGSGAAAGGIAEAVGVGPGAAPRTARRSRWRTPTPSVSVRSASGRG